MFIVIADCKILQKTKQITTKPPRRNSKKEKAPIGRKKGAKSKSDKAVFQRQYSIEIRVGNQRANAFKEILLVHSIIQKDSNKPDNTCKENISFCRNGVMRFSAVNNEGIFHSMDGTFNNNYVAVKIN